MKKQIIAILLAVGVGFILGIFMYRQYGEKEPLKTVFGTDHTVYLIQQGVYSSQENMEKALKEFTYYIYQTENNQYYAYVAMAKSKENATKLKEYFKRIGYDTYMKELTIENDGFQEILAQYDTVLKETTDDKTISAICSQVLAKYEELVLGDEH